MAGQVDDLDKSNIGETLFGLGWRQGVLVASDRLLDVTRGGMDLRSVVPVDPGTKLIIVSQTCDIVAHADIEPVVEALICAVDTERDLGGLINSRRYFAVDSETKLVAYASKTVLIPKDVLLKLTPDDWNWDGDRRSLFVEWFADRWRRPDFPKVLVEHFGRPLGSALKKAKKRATEDWRTIDSHLYQLRVACGDELPGSPLEVSVRGLVKPTAQPAHLTTIRRFVEPFIDAANDVKRSPLRIARLRFNSPADFSLADAWEHRPYDFDYLSSDGEEMSLTAEGPE